MTGRNRLYAVLAVGLVVNLLFFFFFIRGRQGELGDVRDEIESAESETLQLRTSLARLRELQENAPRLEARLAEIRELVPQDDQVGNFLFLVQEAADDAGVGFVQITPQLPKSPPEGAPLAEVRAVIGAEGGYFSLQDFVRRLHALERALRIDNMTLTVPEGEADEGELRLSITARFFFELPSGGGIAPPATTTTPPPAAPSPAASPSPAATTG